MNRPRLRRAVRKIVALLLGFAVVLACLHWRELLLRACLHYCAHRVGAGLPYCDRVEVHLLAPLPFDAIAPSEGFPISGYGKTAPIVETVVVRAAEARRLAAIWRKQDFDFGQQGLCHDGVYGLRFFHGNVLLLETSVCFHCHNFYVPIPGSWWGFDSESANGRALWNSLDALAPYALRAPAEAAFLAEKEKRHGPRDATDTPHTNDP